MRPQVGGIGHQLVGRTTFRRKPGELTLTENAQPAIVATASRPCAC